MEEFLTPRLQELGEEREMLVDEEYELYQGCLQSLEQYPPKRESHYGGTQWLQESEPLEPQETRSSMNMYPQEMPQYGYSPEHMVRGSRGLPWPPHPTLCSQVKQLLSNN